MYQLQDAILTVAKEVQSDPVMFGSEKRNAVLKGTQEVMALFRATGRGFFTRQRRALRRLERYMRINGIDWPIIDWEGLLEWLKENWLTILKVLLTIIPLILL